MELVHYRPAVVLLFCSERIVGKFLTICHIFHFSISPQPKTITGNSVANRAPSLSVDSADLGKSLPLFNMHPNWFILTNGKHPLSSTRNLQFLPNSSHLCKTKLQETSCYHIAFYNIYREDDITPALYPG